ncbi:MAG: M23 family metallopeptidase [Bacteroidales bacterium]|nr:M23 family metallopeptidase [Bacteroidales bacterium]
MKKQHLFKFFIVLLLTFISYSFLRADGFDSALSYRNPLDNSVSLSGSYGELRATHFHSGIDLRVGGVTGAPIYAAADGYISRISVSPTGYGNALYINHLDGKTTLYGHMLDFNPSIAVWVREKQYQKESFRVNLRPSINKFIVKKGDFLGRAGNSGSSGGPHLHFEVRETESQLPLNPLHYSKVKVVDNISPQFQKVNFYSISNFETIPQRELVRSFTGNYSQVIEVPDTFYVAVAGVDKQNNTYAKLAVYRYNYYLDNELIFSFTPEGIPFSKGRYINSVVEFPEKQSSKLSLIKSWVEPGCGITSNITATNNGLFVLSDSHVHEVKIELIDEHKNRAVRVYKVRRALPNKEVAWANRETTSAQTQKDSLAQKSVVMPWFLPNRYESENLRILLPPGALYSSIIFKCDTVRYDGNLFLDVHDKGTPLHNSARMAIKANVPGRLQEKALVVKRGENGKFSSAGGSYSNGWVETSISSFGCYGVAYDTIMPVVTPNFSEGENIAGRRSLRFTIYDNLSGISSYRVQIDGKWVLTSYDPKRKRLETELKGDIIKKGEKHIITIFVTDNKENTNLIKSSFIW